VRAGAVHATRLLPGGDRVALALAAMEDSDVAVRETAASMLVEDGQCEVEGLAAWIEAGQGSARAQHAVLSVLFGRNPPKAVLERIAVRKTEEARACAAARALVQRHRQAHAANGALELFEIVLAERLDQNVHLALRAVEHVEDPTTIRVIRAGLHTGDRRHRANACESVRNLANKVLASQLGDLLEGGESGPVGAAPFSDVAGAVAYFGQSRDPWLRASAGHAQRQGLAEAA
jgi:hypothetical protein